MRKQKVKEVPSHYPSDYELIAAMASSPYEWATVKNGGTVYYQAEKDLYGRKPLRYLRGQLRSYRPFAACALVLLKALYQKYRAECELITTSMFDDYLRNEGSIERYGSFKNYNSRHMSDVFETLLFEVCTSRNKGLQKTLDLLTFVNGDEYHCPEIARSSLLATMLVDGVMKTTTLDEQGVVTPSNGNSKVISQ